MSSVWILTRLELRLSLVASTTLLTKSGVLRKRHLVQFHWMQRVLPETMFIALGRNWKGTTIKAQRLERAKNARSPWLGKYVAKWKLYQGRRSEALRISYHVIRRPCTHIADTVDTMMYRVPRELYPYVKHSRMCKSRLYLFQLFQWRILVVVQFLEYAYIFVSRTYQQ